MLTAHEMLSDDTDQNDADAYFVLFQCLLHTGDDINVLISFELTGPIEKTVEMRLGEIGGEDKIATTELHDFAKETFSPSDAAPTRYTAILDELQRRIHQKNDKMRRWPPPSPIRGFIPSWSRNSRLRKVKMGQAGRMRSLRYCDQLAILLQRKLQRDLGFRD